MSTFPTLICRPERHWPTLKPRTDGTGVGAGWLYYRAVQNGWVPSPELVLNGAIAEALESVDISGVTGEAAARGRSEEEAVEETMPALEMAEAGEGTHFIASEGVKVDLSALLGHAAEKEAAESNDAGGASIGPKASSSRAPTPPEIMDLDGALRMFVDYAIRSATSPQPFLALGTALAVVGALAGRRYCSRTGLFSNYNVIIMAASTAGKDPSRKCVKNILTKSKKLAVYLSGEELGSGQG